MDPFHAQLNEFIRRLGLNDDRINALGRKTYALRQGIRDLYAGGPTVDPVCESLVDGSTLSFAAGPIPDVAIRVVGQTTGETMGTGTSDGAGNFLVPYYASPDDSIFNLYLAGPGPRFKETLVTSSTIARCSLRSVGSRTAAAADDHAYAYEWIYPVAKALVLDDSYYGTRALNGIGSQIWSATGATETVPAGGGGSSCAGGLASIGYSMSGITAGIWVNWSRNPTTLCPNVSGNFVEAAPSSRSVTSVPSVATKLDITWTVAAGSTLSNTLYSGAAATIRVYEP